MHIIDSVFKQKHIKQGRALVHRLITHKYLSFWSNGSLIQPLVSTVTLANIPEQTMRSNCTRGSTSQKQGVSLLQKIPQSSVASPQPLPLCLEQSWGPRARVIDHRMYRWARCTITSGPWHYSHLGTSVVPGSQQWHLRTQVEWCPVTWSLSWDKSEACSAWLPDLLPTGHWSDYAFFSGFIPFLSGTISRKNY